jgi:putative transcription factor
MNCEICGKKIIGRPTQISTDRALLVVCQECTRFGTQVDRKTAATIERTTPKPGPRKFVPRQPRKETFEDFVLVENFGDIIRKGREAQRMTRDAFAHKLGEKESVIRRIEASEMYPTSVLTAKMERLLKVKLRLTVDTSVKGSTPAPSNITLGDIAVLKEGRNN